MPGDWLSLGSCSSLVFVPYFVAWYWFTAGYVLVGIRVAVGKKAVCTAGNGDWKHILHNYDPDSVYSVYEEKQERNFVLMMENVSTEYGCVIYQLF